MAYLANKDVHNYVHRGLHSKREAGGNLKTSGEQYINAGMHEYRPMQIIVK